ncbi:MAG: hypothetical protein BGO01_16275 [Armatimonadetes bacterium 55-13]|nr:sugar ABC transporter ATP-binding protein [Armatimonadota bacterium]OJU65413.1 MAG: hypothetical protein BGO01_16275 [Armatimonadetes bacterium 55-13]
MKEPLISARQIKMSFGGVEVLHGVDLNLYPGEVHAITGENGAGKSTLAKIIAGVHRPTAGELVLNGQPTRLANPKDAAAKGISLIHQEPLTFPDLTVAENIYAGNHPRTKARLVDWKTLREEAATTMANLGLRLSPDAPVKGLSVADQQMIEVASALTHNAQVLILDETTASLTPKEVEELFEIVRRLKAEGRALAFVSHKLEEVFEICDRITVLRDGSKVAELTTQDSSPAEVIRHMVGRDIEATAVTRHHKDQAPRLSIQNLSVPGRVHNVSFDVKPGEVVALAGLVGAGRTDIAHALVGATKMSSGTVQIDGATVEIKTPLDAQKKGLALVPEDRQHHGLLLPLSIAENATLPILENLFKFWVKGSEQVSISKEWIDRLRVACVGPMQPVGSLSGGNQQKVVLAKAVLTKPKVLIVDEPTRGVDVGAKSEVHRLIRELASEGLAVLMISSDLPEVLAVSDRILVMRAGKLVAEYERDQATQESIMFDAAGEAAHAS